MIDKEDLCKFCMYFDYDIDDTHCKLFLYHPYEKCIFENVNKLNNVFFKSQYTELNLQLAENIRQENEKLKYWMKDQAIAMEAKRERIKELRLENEELKNEVRRIKKCGM